jgi:hypothetical protein
VKGRLRVWLLWVWAFSVVGVLVLNLILPPSGLEHAWQWVGGNMAFPVAAALILSKRPGNRVGQAMAVVGTATLVSFVLYWYGITYQDAPLSSVAEVISGAAVVPMFAGMIAGLYLFPTGSTLGGWHRKALAMFLMLASTLVLVFLASPDVNIETGRPNPFAFLPSGATTVVEIGFIILPVFTLLGVASLVVRWRRAGPVERAQLRWFLTAAAIVLVMLTVITLTSDERDDPESLRFVLESAFVILGFWSIPAAVVVAVTRYRLYEIDRLISRTVTYALVVGLLAAVVATIAIGLPQLLGLTDDSPLLVAAATLAVAALFNPLRRRVQSRVDRKFNRSRYDALQEVDRFAERLRAEMGADDITEELIDLVNRTMQPTSAAVWVREAR